jgi:hypothetical protein
MAFIRKLLKKLLACRHRFAIPMRTGSVIRLYCWDCGEPVSEPYNLTANQEGK